MPKEPTEFVNPKETIAETSGAVTVFGPIINANDTTLIRRLVKGKVVPVAAKDGFTVLPSCAGTPTGTPRDKGSTVYDTTNNKLYIWTGTAWKSVTLS